MHPFCTRTVIVSLGCKPGTKTRMILRPQLACALVLALCMKQTCRPMVPRRKNTIFWREFFLTVLLTLDASDHRELDMCGMCMQCLVEATSSWHAHMACLRCATVCFSTFLDDHARESDSLQENGGQAMQFCRIDGCCTRHSRAVQPFIEIHTYA